MRLTGLSCIGSGIIFLLQLCSGVGLAEEAMGPETVVRALVRANVDKDFLTLSQLMAHDDDIVSYTIGGRKYVGWIQFSREMQEEFDAVSRLEIPITELKVWSRGDVAWFHMEVEYIRYVGEEPNQRRTMLPLRETGVLERRHGRWVLLSWHESSRGMDTSGLTAASALAYASVQVSAASPSQPAPDLSGEWDILEVEDNKTYKATLDRSGNGPYTQHGGRFVTTQFSDRRWQGTWHQTGNDRDGGFEVLLSEDGAQAKGVWWYTRVGDRNNIPPRQWGGSYVWKRVTSPPATSH